MLVCLDTGCACVPAANHLTAWPALPPMQAVAQVFDLQNKLVAASAPAEPPVRWIAHSGPGCIDIGAPTAGLGWGGAWGAGLQRSCRHVPGSVHSWHPRPRRLPPAPGACRNSLPRSAGDASGGVARLSDRPFASESAHAQLRLVYPPASAQATPAAA